MANLNHVDYIDGLTPLNADNLNKIKINDTTLANDVELVSQVIVSQQDKLNEHSNKFENTMYFEDGLFGNVEIENNVLGRISSIESVDLPNLQDKINETNSHLETVIHYETSTDSGIDVPSGGENYIHPPTHPASMITGLSNVATSGAYSDLTGKPTKLSEFTNDIGVGSGSGYILPTASATVLGGVKIGANLTIDSNGILSAVTSSGGTTTVSNTLDAYTGSTLNEKMVNMFNDINTNYRETPMIITLPSGNIEITTNLIAKQWKNKVFSCPGNLVFKNCNGIVFDEMQYSDVFIHRASSVAVSSSNTAGLIGLNEVGALTYNGIKLSDCSYNVVRINTIVGFNVGFHLYSEIFSIYSGSSVISGFDALYDCGGTFYNDIYINAIWRCKQGMLLSAGKHALSSGGAGWVNDNRLHNTFFDCNRAVQIGLEYGSRPSGEPADTYQNNKFYNFGFEKIRDTADPVAIDMKQGNCNSFINPRFEASLTNSGYIFIKEGKNATMNRYDTSNYWMNINRVFLNTSSVKDEGTPQGKQHSVVVASFIKEGSGILANKMTAIKNKTAFEGYGIDNYYFSATDTSFSSPNNMINYTFSDTEYAKYRTSTGTIKILSYTS